MPKNEFTGIIIFLSKINLNLVPGSVFDLQNKLHEYRTRFGGFKGIKRNVFFAV